MHGCVLNNENKTQLRFKNNSKQPIFMILIIDNGSQYTHLIKRTCRDLDSESEVLNAREKPEKLEEFLVNGVEKIILSGGPGSVYSDPPNLSSRICECIRDGKIATKTKGPISLLGICYGHQMIANTFGAEVAKGKSAEYGMSEIQVDRDGMILNNMPKKFRAWVSHFDEVKNLPENFVKLAHSDSCEIEAMRHKTKPIFGVQFHPEVWHTENGEKIIKNFLEMK